MIKLAQVLHSADGLAEHRRAELIEAVKAARHEFKVRRCRPATPAQIIKRIFA